MIQRLVIDSSLAVSWCVIDENLNSANSVLDEINAGSVAICPSLWVWEVNNALLLAERRGRLTTEERHRQLFLFQNLPIEIDHAAQQHVWNDVGSIAERFRLTVYDAAYLEMAIRHQLPLGTLDQELRKAADLSGMECVPHKISKKN
ncbi:MAG TPA: type II toxin-antitoxin system VapC family toxin [Tepidisphaeraceae bacterium]